MSLPEPQLPVEGKISPRVATLQTQEAPEAEPPLISFRHYNQKECEIGTGQIKPYAPFMLELIRDMGTKSSYEPNKRHIENAGDYSNLYRGLSDLPDVSIHEIRLEGKVPGSWGKKDQKVNSGRFFYFKIDNTLYVVAIRANHYDTSKGKH